MAFQPCATLVKDPDFKLTALSYSKSANKRDISVQTKVLGGQDFVSRGVVENSLERS
jgi:hypothetical protein